MSLNFTFKQELSLKQLYSVFRTDTIFVLFFSGLNGTARK